MRRINPADNFVAFPGPYVEQMGRDKLKPVDSVTTGFPMWDRVCRDSGGGQGLGRGWHVVVAGRSGYGKTVLGLNLAKEAMGYGEDVYVISLEMSPVQIGTRFLAIATDTPVHLLEQGPWYDRAAHAEAHADLKEISGRKGGAFYVNQLPPGNLEAVMEHMHWALERGCRYFMLDYLQLAAADQNDPGQVSEVSHEIRRFALEHNVNSVALSQFNRETSKNATEKPSIHGLMGGSALENDSTQVVMIDHSRFQPVATGYDSWLIVGKNRSGPVVEIPYHLNAKTLRMYERSQ